ncbi:MAG TPA: hypothetical protein VMY37_39085, partial [Thermoguttaceae bacterium]|nr:hypothetical protein [Thermoguttaceae bacterium]
MPDDAPITHSRQDMEVEHVVLLVHGIRCLGAWHQTVEAVMGSENVRVIMPKYGFFHALKFIAPWDAGKAPMERLYKEYENARREYPNAKVSVIAHSFGTHLRFIRLKRTWGCKEADMLVLCGVLGFDFTRRSQHVHEFTLPRIQGP